MDGKPLAEFRAEIELGITVWVLPEGYCAVCKNSAGEYMYSACTDECWDTWEEMITALGEFALSPIFSLYSPELTRRAQDEEMHCSLCGGYILPQEKHPDAMVHQKCADDYNAYWDDREAEYHYRATGNYIAPTKIQAFNTILGDMEIDL